MQDQADDVGGDEEARVGLRREAREVRAVDDDKPREGEVDGCGEEGGADGERDKVPASCVSCGSAFDRKHVDGQIIRNMETLDG